MNKSLNNRQRAEMMAIIGGLQGHLNTLDSVYFESKHENVSSEIKYQLERLESLKTYLIMDFELIDTLELLNNSRKGEEK